MLSPSQRFHRSAGFTLIEMVMVVTLLGIIGFISTMVILMPLQVGMGMEQRGRMVDNADLALAQLSHELRSALPHSVQIHDGAKHLEFIPVVAAGRYRRTGAGKSLDINDNHGIFDVIGPAIDIDHDDLVISIYNTSLDGHNVYDGENIAEVVELIPTGSSTSIQYDSGTLSTHSPAQRFYLFKAPGPVSYRCSLKDGKLSRYTGYPRSPSDESPNLGEGTSSLLLTGLTSCEFEYTDNLGLVTISFTVDNGSEGFKLSTKVAIVNSP
ncbi:type II secretion system GspH family protein [Ectothiorhodospira haloalkaliphila]|uniref:PulJ/GspJ family protein n=1 Tax=Ectothiorhodospira haloalkaliphila TaxID=421628 RepID=UPI001EE9A1A0|nr:type II secretion system protein [Ectothiorhodospira haloalkaliphila]MCG5525895.1 type II secretion system GspH family protein [Ectothiorhodospira haloalkaliphila]